MNHPSAPPLWEPSEARSRAARISDYQAWVAREMGVQCSDYHALWTWSVTRPDEFWHSLWTYFGIQGSGSLAPALPRADMPGAVWFPQASLNYAERVFRGAHTGPAIVAGDESGTIESIAWPELRRRVAALANTLRSQGIRAGDRVAAYLPNRVEAVVAFLATASLGAIWSLCSPDMGAASVLERWRQIEPRVLLTVDSYAFGGRHHDRQGEVDALLQALPSLELVITVGLRDMPSWRPVAVLDWAQATQGDPPLLFERVPFAHPLWIVYSSGTTGLPKPIVHGHGGIVLEHAKLHALHNDLGPQDRLLWHSSTGWIMWNVLVGALLVGSTICLYDGSPAWPDMDALWRFADQAEATFLGAGAAFYQGCMKAGVVPRAGGRLGRIRSIGSTGSPLSTQAYEWLQAQLGPQVWINPISGGTDIASAFLGGNCTLPVHAGEMQCRCLGASVQAWDDQGRAVTDQVGELVCTRPMPSMPVGFWNDRDGWRLRESYFDHFPGVWRHGDWVEITSRGGAVVYGRSDATINRHGIRMGTSELYAAVEAMPDIADSLVVDLEYLGRESYMALFVVLQAGQTLDESLKGKIVSAIRQALTPKHVPNEILQVPQIPRTLTGKKLEVPIKRLMLGEPVERVINPDALANPASIQWFVDFAARRFT